MKRRTPIKPGKARSYNSTLRARSPKREEYLEKSRYRERSQAAIGKPCKVGSPWCTGIAEGLHHLLPRGAAGGLEAAEEYGPEPVPCCNSCNESVQQKSAGREWAKANGWLLSLRDVA